jgi:hypothetical protein
MEAHLFWVNDEQWAKIEPLCRQTNRALPQRRSADFERDHAGAEGERKLPAWFPPEGKIGNEAGARGWLGRLPEGVRPPQDDRFARWRRGIWQTIFAAAAAPSGLPKQAALVRPIARRTVAPAAEKGGRISGDRALSSRDQFADRDTEIARTQFCRVPNGIESITHFYESILRTTRKRALPLIIQS